MITFYGYAVKKDGRYLGLNPKSGKMQYYKRPKYPLVSGENYAQCKSVEHLGEVVKVKLTMEEVSDEE
ncbi:MAG: hypothetical protein MJZ81_10800 [Bacteroidales bacterium]|nr:hypothetical protein [Bacteroidales bacterium]